MLEADFGDPTPRRAPHSIAATLDGKKYDFRSPIGDSRKVAGRYLLTRRGFPPDLLGRTRICVTLVTSRGAKRPRSAGKPGSHFDGRNTGQKQAERRSRRAH